MTVLANEQVIDGRGWRSGAPVEQRELTQWFFRITDYAEELLDALDTLDRWPEKVRLMQANWIGRSEGLLIRFALGPTTAPAGESELEVFTTRPDTLVRRVLHGDRRPTIRWPPRPRRRIPALAAFIDGVPAPSAPREAAIETAEKKGFDTGIRAVHPFDPSWTLPVYVANFIADGLRHRRHLRLPGARPARPRLRQQIRAAGHAGGHARRTPTPATLPDHRRGLCRRRRDDQFALPRRHDASRQAKEEVARPAGSRAARQSAGGRAQGATTACATGASRASATGAARSR